MSEDANNAFLDRFSSDAEFRARVVAVHDPGARLELIRAEGFADADERAWESTSRLDDDDLDRASGGNDPSACDIHLLTMVGDGVIDGPSTAWE